MRDHRSHSYDLSAEHRRALALLVALGVVACASEAHRDSVAVQNAPIAANVRATPTGAGVASETADDCGLLRSVMNPDPHVLVQHYVELDNAGRFMESTAATDSVYLCPQHLPGPDEFTVVRASEVGPSVASDSVARVVVRSVRLGLMTQDTGGFVFERQAGTVFDTFVVRRTSFGWRIESPELPDRVQALAVLGNAERFHLRPQVRDSLQAVVSRPDP